MVARKAKLTFEEWKNQYDATIKRQINEEFKRVSEAIMKPLELKPEPKLIVDKLKAVTDEVRKLKLTMAGVNTAIEASVTPHGVDLIEISSGRCKTIHLNMEEILLLRDWMTTLLGEDKVIHRERMILPVGSGHIPMSINTTDSEFVPFLLGMAVMGGLWALVHFFL